MFNNFSNLTLFLIILLSLLQAFYTIHWWQLSSTFLIDCVIKLVLQCIYFFLSKSCIPLVIVVLCPSFIVPCSVTLILIFRLLDENNGIQKEMDMGNLFDSISQKGFLVKRKRSVMPEKADILQSRHSARFSRFLSVESETSE